MTDDRDRRIRELEDRIEALERVADGLAAKVREAFDGHRTTGEMAAYAEYLEVR